MEQSDLDLSVVVPCYNEEGSLPEFAERCSAACILAVGNSHEIILVDDGSRDQTWMMIEQLSARDHRVIGVRLIRNHGHQLAASAGLALCRGQRVLLIDADLQDPPECLAPMMALMDAGADVVYGQRSSRQGETWFKLATASAFYKLLSHLTDVPIPRDTGDFRLMARNVVDILNSMPERHRFIRGMVSWIGGKQVPLIYERHARFAGSSHYPIRKMVRLAVDAITSFSTKPLRLAVWLGIGVSLLAFMLLFYAVFRWATGNVVPGWASSLISTALFAGTQLFVLGIFGEYLGRLVEDVKRRPLFMIGAIRARGQTFAPPREFGRSSLDDRQVFVPAIMSADMIGPHAEL